MARGNQRDKAREANQKKLADQKKHNTMSGTEMQREKEKVAQKMREKQAAADAKKAAGVAEAANKK
ncbi:putative serf family protein [Amylocarpus encephaloides]|uniref:Serf family protein n=1 Tax=Amylocarpus encephaloides TaxID=45428 RepID=A0A9P7YJ72_9HELO|nr:putative serf family protein [Amylocarpus encephaloides]